MLRCFFAVLVVGRRRCIGGGEEEVDVDADDDERFVRLEAAARRAELRVGLLDGFDASCRLLVGPLLGGGDN